ncbi:MAG: hypothetical protein J6W16_05215, partial [Methanobrevibacter sp.]|nr:hypothetical protein [Methanobrevibacter sp.]
MKEIKIDIESLYDLLAKKYEVQHKKSYEVIYPKDYEIKILGNKYVKLVAVSRHKTSKHLIKIFVKSEKEVDSLDPVGQKSLLRRYDEVTVTTDHICMRYDKDHFFENVNAKNLKINDYVSVYDEADDKELIGTIVNIEDLGTTDDWVYDCEVDDDSHAFYASNILCHNSQFCNIQCVTDDFKKKYGLNDDLAKWDDDSKLKLWK